MGEVRVTYETLFDLLRREKARNELQVLDKGFFEDVVSYLKEKEGMLEKASFSVGEKEKIRIQLKNVRKILKELYEIREKKVLGLALNKVRTGTELIDTSSFLGVEEDLFNDAVGLLTKYKEEVLLKVINGEAPKGFTEDKEQLRANQPQQSVAEKKMDSGQDKPGKVRFLADTPKFVGFDKEIYGPFKKGEEAELPGSVASLLLKKGRVEEA